MRLWSQEKATRDEAPEKSRGFKVKSQEEILQTGGVIVWLVGTSYAPWGCESFPRRFTRDLNCVIHGSSRASVAPLDRIVQIPEQARAAHSATIDWKGVFHYRVNLVEGERSRRGLFETLASLALSPGLSILVVSAVSSHAPVGKKFVLLLPPGEACVVKLRISIDRVHKPQCPKRPSLTS